MKRMSRRHQLKGWMQDLVLEAIHQKRMPVRQVAFWSFASSVLFFTLLSTLFSLDQEPQDNYQPASFLAAPDCPPVPVTNPYIGGNIYKDIGQDGALTNNIDKPIAGVTITVYGSSGVIGSTTSSADGDYLLESAMLNPMESYRVEFSNFPAGLEPSIVGGDNASSVQFVSTNSCNVDFGLTKPDEYVQPDPGLVTNCYILGDNINDPGDVLISID